MLLIPRINSKFGRVLAIALKWVACNFWNHKYNGHFFSQGSSFSSFDTFSLGLLGISQWWMTSSCRQFTVWLTNLSKTGVDNSFLLRWCLKSNWLLKRYITKFSLMLWLLPVKDFLSTYNSKGKAGCFSYFSLVLISQILTLAFDFMELFMVQSFDLKMTRSCDSQVQIIVPL